MKRAVYPGSFDPPSNGHMDVIKRGSRLFDELVIGLGVNPDKHPLFSEEERIGIIRELVKPFDNVRVESFRGLVVDFAHTLGANVILRGIRTPSDFEFELQMALTNRTLAPDIETVYVMTSEKYSFISSRLVREAASLGANVEPFCPPFVVEKLREKFPE